MLYSLISTSASSFLPYCIIALLTMAEGPIITLMGGAAISSGLLLPLPVYLSIVIGNLSADMGWYALGRFGKLDRLKGFLQKKRVDIQRIEQLEKNIQVYAPRLLFLAKLTVGFPIPTLIATGMGRVPVHRWVGMLVLGELIKTIILVGVGYVFSHSIQQASSSVQMVLWGITAALLVTGWVWFKRRRSTRNMIAR